MLPSHLVNGRPGDSAESQVLSIPETRTELISQRVVTYREQDVSTHSCTGAILAIVDRT
jgi:hypothetical protein